jgi:HSP20 family protein
MMTRFNFHELDAVRRELERAFQGPLMDLAQELSNPVNRGRRDFPPVSLHENAEGFEVEAQAPGLDPEKIEITVNRNKLTIVGEREVADEPANHVSQHRSERAIGKFTRTLTLPTEVDESKVAAEYKNGMLTIHLPKAESAKPRRIAIATA